MRGNQMAVGCDQASTSAGALKTDLDVYRGMGEEGREQMLTSV